MWAVTSSPLFICCIWPRNTDHLMNQSVQFGSTSPSPSKVDHTRRGALAVWWPWRKLWTLRVHAHSRMCFWGVHWRPLDVSQLGKPPLGICQHQAGAGISWVLWNPRWYGATRTANHATTSMMHMMPRSSRRKQILGKSSHPCFSIGAPY